MKNIISHFKKNNTFEVILLPHINDLFRQAYQYTGSKEDAEDLLQNLLLHLYQQQTELTSIEKLKPWLFRCLYYRFIDDYRSKKRKIVTQVITDSDMHSAGMQADKCAEEDKIYHEVNQALDCLPKKQRAIICLHDIEGYTLTELNKMLKIPLGTLKSTLHRGRASLKKQLGMEPFQDN